MKKILLTGGGTAGHVTPNIALLPSLKKAGYEIKYMGSYDGIEKKLIEELGIDYIGYIFRQAQKIYVCQKLYRPFSCHKRIF